MGMWVPFVRFLKLPEGKCFETGKFPRLNKFLRGYLSVIDPTANRRIISANNQIPAIYTRLAITGVDAP